eukprot:scaffold897_cov402-Prasinococcus_capsulatus_cf.AAC.69
MWRLAWSENPVQPCVSASRIQAWPEQRHPYATAKYGALAARPRRVVPLPDASSAWYTSRSSFEVGLRARRSSVVDDAAEQRAVGRVTSSRGSPEPSQPCSVSNSRILRLHNKCWNVLLPSPRNHSVRGCWVRRSVGRVGELHVQLCPRPLVACGPAAGMDTLGPGDGEALFLVNMGLDGGLLFQNQTLESLGGWPSQLNV